MNNFYYAQLNDDNICIGVSSLSGEVKSEKLIRIEEFSNDYLQKKYENGKWSKEKIIIEHIPTLEEERQRYINLIKNAQLLGEEDEIKRLQQEWATKKLKYEK